MMKKTSWCLMANKRKRKSCVYNKSIGQKLLNSVIIIIIIIWTSFFTQIRNFILTLEQRNYFSNSLLLSRIKSRRNHLRELVLKFKFKSKTKKFWKKERERENLILLTAEIKTLPFLFLCNSLTSPSLCCFSPAHLPSKEREKQKNGSCI